MSELIGPWPTYDWRPQGDSQASEEHEDAVGFRELLLAHYLVGDVRGQRPVAAQEAHPHSQDLQPQVEPARRGQEVTQHSEHAFFAC